MNVALGEHFPTTDQAHNKEYIYQVKVQVIDYCCCNCENAKGGKPHENHFDDGFSHHTESRKCVIVFPCNRR